MHKTTLYKTVFLKQIFAVWVFVATSLCLPAPRAVALPLETYASHSRLSTGYWVKVSVPTSGMYSISASQLRQWGFSNPERVRVFGYGGARIADQLSQTTYIDDLPPVQSEYTQANGLVFYGVGPDTWETAVSGRYRQKPNIYATEGYYYLGEYEPDEEGGEQGIPLVGSAGAENPTTQFWDRRHHEIDLTSVGEAGYLLVGEDFRQNRKQTITFDTPDAESLKMWFEASIITKTYNSASYVDVDINGTRLERNSTCSLPPTSGNSHYVHASEGLVRYTFDNTEPKTTVTFNYSSPVTIHGAWINYVSLNYSRALRLPAERVLQFWSASAAMSLDRSVLKAEDDLRVWDVTNPQSILRLATSEPDAEGRTSWTHQYYGNRAYVAWTETSTMGTPSYCGVVPNQDLHADENVDMIIVTLPEFKSQAERIARLHETSPTRPLKVKVAVTTDVYNEFASGCADVSALRKYFKMHYDRSHSEEGGPQLRYALLMGRATYDNRHVSPAFKSLGFNTIPSYYNGTTKTQLTDNDGFGTDDFVAMLEDKTGTNMGLHDLNIAVGRMPVRTVAEAKNAVDKLTQYLNNPAPSSWKNTYLFLSDDEDSGTHMRQTENMINAMRKVDNQQSFINKVYIDAYDKIGGEYPQARHDMFQLLDEGVMWWNFIGHANNHSFTHDGQFTYNDINNLYLKNVPILFAATCDFLRWDSNTLSGGEILFHERYGGTIATISATRPVYIPDNGLFTEAMGRALNSRAADGQLNTLGEVYRRAKNDIRNSKGDHVSNTNRLRFVLMGDPAMPLPTPSNTIRIDAIGGKPLDNADEPVVIAALERTTIRGAILSPDGTVIEDFNGSITATIYDAEHSTTSKGHGEGIEFTFEQIGTKLFAGSGLVKDGYFEVNVAMPAEITGNYRPASINMYAYDATTPHVEASGVDNRFYVYGFDESADTDTERPVIETMVLNHPSFENGGKVNTTPVLIAEVRDNVGINLSQAGIGHQMTVIIDEHRTLTDVARYFTHSTDGTPSGKITYQLPELTPGHHTITLRVWDTSGNSGVSTIECYVEKELSPTLYKVYSDANPASVEANFYLSHDRPNSLATVTVTVYNLLGQPVWEGTSRGMSQDFLSTPLTWDLTDSAGRRVSRGIYVYRARITVDGTSYGTGAQRIAVTGAN